MGLSVTVHKDIGEYQEKVVGKLSLRTLACVAGGLSVSVAVAAALHFLAGIDPSDASLPVMACSMPFWLMGFWRPHGMRAERFCPLLAEHALTDCRLAYTTGFMRGGRPTEDLRMHETRRYRRRSRRKGAELREPGKEQG